MVSVCIVIVNRRLTGQLDINTAKLHNSKDDEKQKIIIDPNQNQSKNFL